MQAETQFGNGALEDAALDLAAQEATGRLLVSGTEGLYGWLWLRDGLLSGASGPGSRPLIANRLATFELLAKSQIGKLISETRSRPGARMIEVLIERDAVPAEFIAEFLAVAAAEQIAHLEAMPISAVRFEPGVVHRAGPSDLTVQAALTACRSMRTELAGVDAETTFATSTSTSGIREPVARSLASYCDGSRTLTQIAHVAGLTHHETILWLEGMLAAGQIATTQTQPALTDWEHQTPLPQATATSEPEPAPGTGRTDPTASETIPATRPPLPSGPTDALSDEPEPVPPAPQPPTDAPRDQAPDAASDRRHLLSTLAALSAEADSHRPTKDQTRPGSSSDAEAEQSEGQKVAGSASRDSDADESETQFSAETPTGGRGIASEMFRELHSLGED
ncbi:MAG: hypothetical protein K0U64_11810 [Actinomycetia bacterium]|nr:hypothetical protein [Actinomycetes bacterium]